MLLIKRLRMASARRPEQRPEQVRWGQSALNCQMPRICKPVRPPCLRAPPGPGSGLEQHLLPSSRKRLMQIPVRPSKIPANPQGQCRESALTVTPSHPGGSPLEASAGETRAAAARPVAAADESGQPAPRDSERAGFARGGGSLRQSERLGS